MCSDEQHRQSYITLKDIEKAILSTQKRPSIDSTIQVSNSQPFIVDYKERRHIFVWSPNAITFTIEDLGTFSLSANTWTNMGGFSAGMRLTPSNQSSLVPLFMRCTDEAVQ